MQQPSQSYYFLRLLPRIKKLMFLHAYKRYVDNTCLTANPDYLWATEQPASEVARLSILLNTMYSHTEGGNFTTYFPLSVILGVNPQERKTKTLLCATQFTIRLLCCLGYILVYAASINLIIWSWSSLVIFNSARLTWPETGAPISSNQHYKPCILPIWPH